MSDKLNPTFPYKIEKAHWYLLLLWREKILTDEEFEHVMIRLQNKLDNQERTVQEVKTPIECEHYGYLKYICPTCIAQKKLFREQNHCLFCGQAVKWE